MLFYWLGIVGWFPGVFEIELLELAEGLIVALTPKELLFEKGPFTLYFHNDVMIKNSKDFIIDDLRGQSQRQIKRKGSRQIKVKVEG